MGTPVAPLQDRDHPQDLFEKNDGKSTWNHLINAVLRFEPTQQMYLARLRTLLDNYLASGWLERQVRSFSLTQRIRHTGLSQGTY